MRRVVGRERRGRGRLRDIVLTEVCVDHGGEVMPIVLRSLRCLMPRLSSEKSACADVFSYGNGFLRRL